MYLVNVSIDDVSPHPQSSTKVLERCRELINVYPDIKFTLFIPAAYWRTKSQTTEKPLYLNEFPDFCKEINGLDQNEEKLVKEKLKFILNLNSFFLNKKIILENLNQFNFLDSVTVQKILPSEININLIKTTFAGRTIIDGEKYYIGKNGKITHVGICIGESGIIHCQGWVKEESLSKHKKMFNQKLLDMYMYSCSIKLNLER